jgi:geranylgeranyl pyrophosphate synthase
LRRAYRELLPVGGETEEHLRGVLEDVLGHPGRLIRAQVAYGLLARYPVTRSAACGMAIAIEYFHAASLIFDDLPSMDNATERRGRPCPHRIYGEAAATLGALALVNQAYALLWRAFGELSVARARASAELVSECLGLHGLLDGQARDLHFRARPLGAEPILAVAEGKTVALIRLTLVLPALAGGDDESVAAGLGALARAWGLSYQIIDDFHDALLPTEETGKSRAMDEPRGRPNLPLGVGPDEAMARLTGLLDEGRSELAALRAESGGWGVLERLSELLDGQAQIVLARMRVAECA